MVTKTIQNLSNVNEKGIEINSNKKITAGTYNNVISNFDFLICDTNSGDITIQGFNDGTIGQKITIIKSNPNNSIFIINENSTSNKKIKNISKSNEQFLKGKTGVFEIFCDGDFWYCNAESNFFVFNAVISASAQNIITINNCLSVIFKFCVECSTGTATVKIDATKLNLTSSTGKFTQISNVVAGTMNNKITYSVTFTNTSISLKIITSAVVAAVTGEYKVLK